MGSVANCCHMREKLVQALHPEESQAIVNKWMKLEAKIQEILGGILIEPYFKILKSFYIV